MDIKENSEYKMTVNKYYKKRQEEITRTMGV